MIFSSQTKKYLNMATATRNRVINLIFQTEGKIINPDVLLEFSEKYNEELKKIITYLKTNESNYNTRLFFTRILPDGTMKKKREFLGTPKNVSEKGFDFLNAWDISKDNLTDNDDGFKNQVVFENILGILPTFGIITLEEILVIKNTEIAKKYFNFWNKTKETLNSFLNKPHHVEIYLSNNMVIEGEVLEINKSNILIYSKSERKNELQNGSYVKVNIVPHERFLYFISSEYFIQKIRIIPWKVNINPYDED